MNYTVSDLLHGAKVMSKSVFGKKNEYQLRFNHEEDGKWYVVRGEVTYDKWTRLKVSGTVNLILCDKAVLTAKQIPFVQIMDAVSLTAKGIDHVPVLETEDGNLLSGKSLIQYLNRL